MQMFSRFLALIGILLWKITAADAALLADPVYLEEVHPGRHVVTHAVVRNDSDQTLTIEKQRTGPDRLAATNLPLDVPAHGSAEIAFDVHVDREVGAQSYQAALDVAGEQKPLIARVSLFVHSMVDFDPAELDLGTVVAGGTQTERRAKLTSAEVADLRAISARDEKAQVTAELSGHGTTLAVKTRAEAPWGARTGWIRLQTNATEQPEAWIKYRYELRGEVVPDTYALEAGLVRKGKVLPQTVFIRNVKGKPLRLGKISLDQVSADVKDVDCPQKEPSCRAVEVRVNDNQPFGWFAGVVRIELPQHKQTLDIRYGGILVDADTEITELNSTNMKAAETDLPKADVAAAIKAATQEKPAPIVMPTPAGSGPVLKWQVQNEQQIYGYIIYRADTEDGPAHRINAALIRPLSTQDGVLVAYQWRDQTARPGHDYWYQIGTVDRRDVRKDLTGRAKKTYAAESTEAR